MGSSKKNKKNRTGKDEIAAPINSSFDKKLIKRLSVFLFAVSFLLYVNTLNHEYVFDDIGVIKENALTKAGIHSIKEILSSSYREGSMHNDHGTYRPLSKVMFAIEWQIAPDKPFLGHLVNIIFYSIVCVLIFIMLLRFIRMNIYVLFLASLIFAVHPVHTEVVANIKSRDELLSAFFILLSLLSVHNYILNKRLLSLLASLVCFFLSLLSKESAIVYVALAPLFIYFFTGSPIKQNLKITSLIALTAISYLMVHMKVMGHIGLPNVHPTDNSLLMADSYFQQKATAILILGKYLWLLFFPHPLSGDYSFNVIPIVTSVANPGFLLSFILHVSLLFYAITRFRQKHFLSFCILFYLISMAVASNIFMTIGTNMAERLLFFPSIGFCLAMAYLVGRASKLDFQNLRPKLSVVLNSNKLMMTILGMVLLLFSIKSINRNADWKSGVILNTADLKTFPNSTHLLFFHAADLIRDESLLGLSREERNDRFTLAQQEINKALSIYEPIPDAHNIAGKIWYEYKNYDSAYKEYSRALYLNPDIAAYHNDVATCLFAKGKYEEAAKGFKKATELHASNPEAFCNLGSAYGEIGLTFRRNKDEVNARKYLLLAIDNFAIATRLKPDYKSAFQFQGLTYNSIGDTVNGTKYLGIANQLQ